MPHVISTKKNDIAIEVLTDQVINNNFVVAFTQGFVGGLGGSGQYVFFMHQNKLSCLPVRECDLEDGVGFEDLLINQLHLVDLKETRLTPVIAPLDDEIKDRLKEQLRADDFFSLAEIRQLKETLSNRAIEEQAARDQAAEKCLNLVFPLAGCELSQKIQEMFYASAGLIRGASSLKSYIKDLLADGAFENDHRKIAALVALISTGEKQDAIFSKDKKNYQYSVTTLDYSISQASCYLSPRSIVNYHLPDELKSSLTIGQVFYFFQACIRQVVKQLDPAYDISTEDLATLSLLVANTLIGHELPESESDKNDRQAERERIDCLENVISNILIEQNNARSGYLDSLLSPAQNNNDQVNVANRQRFQNHVVDVLLALEDLLDVADQRQSTTQRIQNKSIYDTVAAIIYADNSSSDDQIIGLLRKTSIKDKLSSAQKRIKTSLNDTDRKKYIYVLLKEAGFDADRVLEKIDNLSKVNGHFPIANTLIALVRAGFEVNQILGVMDTFAIAQDPYALMHGFIALKEAGFEAELLLNKVDTFAAVNNIFNLSRALTMLKEEGFCVDKLFEKIDVLDAAQDIFAFAKALIRLVALGFNADRLLEKCDCFSKVKNPTELVAVLISLNCAGFDFYQLLEKSDCLSKVENLQVVLVFLKAAGFDADRLLEKIDILVTVENVTEFVEVLVKLVVQGFNADRLLEKCDCRSKMKNLQEASAELMLLKKAGFDADRLLEKCDCRSKMENLQEASAVLMLLKKAGFDADRLLEKSDCFSKVKNLAEFVAVLMFLNGAGFDFYQLLEKSDCQSKVENLQAASAMLVLLKKAGFNAEQLLEKSNCLINVASPEAFANDLIFLNKVGFDHVIILEHVEQISAIKRFQVFAAVIRELKEKNQFEHGDCEHQSMIIKLVCHYEEMGGCLKNLSEDVEKNRKNAGFFNRFETKYSLIGRLMAAMYINNQADLKHYSSRPAQYFSGAQKTLGEMIGALQARLDGKIADLPKNGGSEDAKNKIKSKATYKTLVQLGLNPDRHFQVRAERADVPASGYMQSPARWLS